MSFRIRRTCVKDSQTSLVALWLRFHAPNAGHLGLIPGQGTRSHKEQLSVAAAAAKSLQSCLTLCNLIDGSPPDSPVPGILQARTLEWVAILFFNAGKWKWKWSCSVVSDSLQPHGLQPTRLLRPWDFPGKSTGVGCHCLLRTKCYHAATKTQCREIINKY